MSYHDTPVPVSNRDVARIFLRIAEMMSYRDESTFKVRAYYRAALTLSALSTPLSEVAVRHELQTLPGIGEAIAGKIEEILETGTCVLYDRLKTEVSATVRELLQFSGLTPRLVRLLEQEFNVSSLEALRALTEAGELAEWEGTALKVEDAAQILRACEGLGYVFTPTAP